MTPRRTNSKVNNQKKPNFYYVDELGNEFDQDHNLVRSVADRVAHPQGGRKPPAQRQPPAHRANRKKSVKNPLVETGEGEDQQTENAAASIQTPRAPQDGPRPERHTSRGSSPVPIPSIAVLKAVPSPGSRGSLLPDSTLRPGTGAPTYAAVANPAIRRTPIRRNASESPAPQDGDSPTVDSDDASPERDLQAKRTNSSSQPTTGLSSVAAKRKRKEPHASDQTNGTADESPPPMKKRQVLTSTRRFELRQAADERSVAELAKRKAIALASVRARKIGPPLPPEDISSTSTPRTASSISGTTTIRRADESGVAELLVPVLPEHPRTTSLTIASNVPAPLEHSKTTTANRTEDTHLVGHPAPVSPEHDRTTPAALARGVTTVHDKRQSTSGSVKKKSMARKTTAESADVQKTAPEVTEDAKQKREMIKFRIPADGDDLQGLLTAGDEKSTRDGGNHGHCYPARRMCVTVQDGEEEMVCFKNSIPKHHESVDCRLSGTVISKKRHAQWDSLARAGQRVSEISRTLTVIVHLDTARRKPEIDIWANPWAMYYMGDEIDAFAASMYEASKKIERDCPDQQATSSVTTKMARDAQISFEKASRELEKQKQSNRELREELKILRAGRSRHSDHSSDHSSD